MPNFYSLAEFKRFVQILVTSIPSNPLEIVFGYKNSLLTIPPPMTLPVTINVIADDANTCRILLGATFVQVYCYISRIHEYESRLGNQKTKCTNKFMHQGQVSVTKQRVQNRSDVRLLTEIIVSTFPKTYLTYPI